jgi:tetratricopeptide (TPR) repeat protein
MPRVSCNKRIVAMTAVLLLAVAAHVPVGYAEYVNPTITDPDSPVYWLDQGGLFSAYGNYPAAVRAYEKSLALNPRNSEALFGLGVALGAMTDYDGALANIDRAIRMAPDNGRYLYGRAWVLMLSGRTDESLSVFRRASELGDMDAQMYLKYLETVR